MFWQCGVISSTTISLEHSGGSFQFLEAMDFVALLVKLPNRNTLWDNEELYKGHCR